MTFLSILALTVGLATATAPPASASPALQAEARLDYMVTAMMPELRQRTLSRARAFVMRRARETLARQIATYRDGATARLVAREPARRVQASDLALQARATLDRMVAETRRAMRQATNKQLMASTKKQLTTSLAGAPPQPARVQNRKVAKTAPSATRSAPLKVRLATRER